MKKVNTFFFFVTGLLFLSGCSDQFQTGLPTPPPDPEKVVVDLNYQLGEISPYVYGVNHGPWAFVTTKVLPQAIEGGFSFIRFPGGNWGDLNTMTPLEIENNAALAEMLGAELSISVRLRGGTPEEAAELVQVANQELDLNVKYWSIGNEPELYGDYDTIRYNQEWRQIAEAMLAVDPEILFIGPDVTQFTGNPASDPQDENGLYWIDEFLKSNGDLVDIISIHRYPFPKSLASQAITRQELYDSVEEWDSIIPALRSKVLELTGKELPVAVTEVNSHWTNVTGQEASPDSFANAIWWADVLSRMIDQDVEIVTFFSLQSNASIGSFGLFERYDTRPTYYVYQLYQQMGSRKIFASSPDDNVTAIASQCVDGDITLLFVNRAFFDKHLLLEVKESEKLVNQRAYLLTEDVLAEEVLPETYLDPAAVSLPAESVFQVTYSEDNLFCGESTE
jgi:hypothetical protein